VYFIFIFALLGILKSFERLYGAGAATWPLNIIVIV